MKIASRWFALFLCFLYFRLAAQPNPRFDLVTIEEGVSNGFFTAICQDKEGRIWLGTALGLNCYDGYSFRSFLSRGDSSNSLINYTIWALACDKEDNLWIGTAGGLNKLDLSTEAFSSFFHDPSDELSLSHNSVESIAIDSAGQVWIGTANGLNLWRKEHSNFIRYLYKASPADPRMVKSVFCDSRDVLWVGAADTLFQYQDGRFASFPLPAIDERRRSELQVRTIYEDSQNQLWIGTQGSGLFAFEKNARKFVLHYQHGADNENSLSHNKIAAILEDEAGQIWAATYGGGLNIINEITNTVRRFNIGSANSISVKDLRSMSKDKAGNFWIGSSYEGLYLVKRLHKRFHNYSKKNSALSGKTTAFHEDEEGKIWIGTFEGLNRFDPEEDRFLSLQEKPGLNKSLLYDKINAITMDRAGNLWTISNAKKIAKYNPAGNTLTSLPPIHFEGGGDLIQILATREDDIWIGSNNGICKYEKTMQRVVYYTLEKREGFGDNKRITALYEDSQNTLWVSTYNGLNRYDRQKDAFTYYPCSYEIMAICESQNGVIWAGTRIGLAKLDRAKEQFQYLHDLKGMPRSKSVNAILEDQNQRLWFSTNDGIYSFDPVTQEVNSYNRNDGLINNQFLNASLRTRSGEMYFSGISGFTRFKPEEIKKNTKPPSVLITNFQLFNQDVPIAGSPGDTLEWPSPLAKAISYTSKIKLKHWQNDFSFEFAALDFTASENNQYEHQLDGYDDKWIATGAQRRYASYSNLDPGDYVFKVRASNNDGFWNGEGVNLKIIIIPPWWQTWPAYLVYATIAFLLIRTLYFFQLKRKLAQAEAQRLRELDALKTRLFTNITHEFRTPLTIILGMARQIKDNPKKWYSEGLEMITRNGRRLLNLVNQMMDLSKLDKGKLTLKMQQGEIIGFLHYLIQSFEYFAAGKNIQLHFIKETDRLEMDFDPDQLTKVVSNLLSNAVKYTPKGGQTYVLVRREGVESQGVENREAGSQRRGIDGGSFVLEPANEYLLIKIKDTGAGIAREDLPYIFDRFYQADSSATRKGEGTGIGLALTRELVRLMGGAIQVQSKLGEGTDFSVLLPIRRSTPKAEAIPRSVDIPNLDAMVPMGMIDASAVKTGGYDKNVSPGSPHSGDLPTVLLIEDNRDVLTYLASCLEADYQLEFALNGQEGIDLALEIVPDIVISDLMMPEKDGYEVCAALNADVRTSHIPIILLTAKADQDSRIAGLKSGADAYLAKPFDKEELYVRLEKLLELRRRLQARYSDPAAISTVEEKSMSKEELFLRDLRKIIEENLSDQSFGVMQLCRKIGMSRSQLHNKLKALTGQSTSLYVRAVRLEKAKTLLRTTDMNISEVAYEAGFRTPVYFTQVFTKDVGVSPRQFKNS